MPSTELDERRAAYRVNLAAVRSARDAFRACIGSHPYPMSRAIMRARNALSHLRLGDAAIGDARITQILGRLFVQAAHPLLYSTRPLRYSELDSEPETCPSCGRAVTLNTMFEVDNGESDSRCIHCLNPDEWECNFLQLTAYTIQHDEWEEPEDDGGRSELHSYSASPIDILGKPYLLGSKEGPATESTRFFGCELEFVPPDSERRDDFATSDICREIGIMKEDNSLPYPGAEFCLLPMTRAAAVEKLQKPLDYITRNGGRAWHRQSCGLHIHVSRASASWLTWGKVDRFFLNSGNRHFLTLVAGRPPNNYCRSEPVLNPISYPVKNARHKVLFGSERYMQLNFATGRPTVEFRLFRGNLAYTGILRCIEFCDSILEFAVTQSNTSAMTFGDYLAWLKPRSGAYPHLAHRLRRGESLENTGSEEDAA